MATDSSILAWRIPWTEEPGGSRSIGLQSLAWLSDQATRTPPKFQIIKQLQEQNCAWAHLTGGLKLARVNRKTFLMMTFCSESKSFGIQAYSSRPRKKAWVAAARSRRAGGSLLRMKRQQRPGRAGMLALGWSPVKRKTHAEGELDEICAFKRPLWLSLCSLYLIPL